MQGRKGGREGGDGEGNSRFESNLVFIMFESSLYSTVPGSCSYNVEVKGVSGFMTSRS